MLRARHKEVLEQDKITATHNSFVSRSGENQHNIREGENNCVSVWPTVGRGICPFTCLQEYARAMFICLSVYLFTRYHNYIYTPFKQFLPNLFPSHLSSAVLLCCNQA